MKGKTIKTEVWSITLDEKLVYYNDSATLYFFRTREAAKAEAGAHGFKVVKCKITYKI